MDRLNHKSFGVRSRAAKEICRALGAAGILKVDDAKRYFGISGFNEAVESGLVKEVFTISPGDTARLIHLTRKGREYTRKHITYGSLYTWNRMQIKHDLELSKVYLSLTPQERMSWRNESQMRLFSKGAVSGIDGSFIRNGKRIAVEIVTPNYPSSKLSMKIEMINKHFDGMEIRCVQ